MIRQEYAIWMRLGGRINSLDVVDDIQDRLRETVVFKRLPEIMSEEERQALLDKATMYLMAHDYARLVETIHRTQEALKSDDAQLAQTIMEFIFE